ncbi:uncharacterized protein LOC34620938 [Cyclospora cayetanensis]|uniref:Uncharacterized protein LOC34620938 n=1 Tax=Cyclospora cayetanensis TaxID=88456 RepID=A0A6P6RUY5_9EIME|nr:uncharacterized protein LOC34620938 [Cyclospora cayetanensis]
MPTGLFRPMGPDADDAEVDDSYEKEINELLPSIIDSRRHMHYIQLSQEGLVATFVGKGDYTDVGAVQSDHAFPRTCPIAYYEIRILKAAAVRPQICVGLAPASTLLNRTPGLEPRSVGYRAEDGRCHYRKGRTGPSSSDSVNWEPFGPAYGQGDIRQLLEERQLIRQEHLLPSVLQSLVRSYLLHSGFLKTLRAFDRATSEQQGKVRSLLSFFVGSLTGEGDICTEGAPQDTVKAMRETPQATGAPDEEMYSLAKSINARSTTNTHSNANSDKSQSPESATADYLSQEVRLWKYLSSDGRRREGRQAQQMERAIRALAEISILSITYWLEKNGGKKHSKEDQEAVLDMWPAAVSRRLSRSLVRRADVVALIMEGRISEAVLFLAEHFPLVLEPTTWADENETIDSPCACKALLIFNTFAASKRMLHGYSFALDFPCVQDDASCLARALLYTQEVVECIRPPNGDFTAAIRCMQSRIAPLTSQVPPFIQKAIKVRLYSWATKDSSHHLLDRNQGESETFTSSADFGHIAKKR